MTCNPILIQFTRKGKDTLEWEGGNTWSLKLQLKQVLIQDGHLTYSTVSKSNKVWMGPNLILPLAPQARVPSQRPQILGKMVPQTPPRWSNIPVFTPLTGSSPWDLLKATYTVLNISHPGWTADCWSYLDTQPPYYEGIAILADYIRLQWSPLAGGLKDTP